MNQEELHDLIAKHQPNICQVVAYKNNEKVYSDCWNDYKADDCTHIMSATKSIIALLIGIALDKGQIGSIDDKVLNYFPDYKVKRGEKTIYDVTIRHLLTMTTGHDVALNVRTLTDEEDWVATFLATPVKHEPGTFYVYNTLGSYMLSAIVQKVTGQKIIDYLYPRLFRPLGIVGATWQESPQGINLGGWGLFLKTEDLAKVGQLFLQRGQWNGRQILPSSWVDEATAKQTECCPAGMRFDDITVSPKDSDWVQGYGYQMWRCRHNAVRADGADGQYIIILPDQNAVIAMTAAIGDMQSEINLVWKHLLPALR